MFQFFLFMLVAFQLMPGCSGGTKSLKPAHNSDCETTIEGFLYSEGEWLGDYPAIVVKTDDGERTYAGELVAVEENGIRFDPKPLSFFVNKPERLYTYNELLFAIDEDYQIILGSPPTALNMTFELTPENGEEPVEFTLRSGLKTASCIKPGSYTVSNIEFWNGYKYREKCVSLPKVTWNIEAGRVNSLGNIHLDDNSQKETDTVLRLPYEVSLRGEYGSNGIRPTYGAPGGITSLGRTSIIRRSVAEGEHTLSIKFDKKPKSSDKHYAPLRFVW